ncbi:hypothetical protein [Pseudomonas sp. B1-22]
MINQAMVTGQAWASAALGLYDIEQLPFEASMARQIKSESLHRYDALLQCRAVVAAFGRDWRLAGNFRFPLLFSVGIQALVLGILEIEMDEIVDFASVLMKLVIILAIMLMAGSLVVMPDRAGGFVPSMLMLIVPLFVLTTLLDLAGIFRRRSVDSFPSKRPSRG